MGGSRGRRRTNTWARNRGQRPEVRGTACVRSTQFACKRKVFTLPRRRVCARAHDVRNDRRAPCSGTRVLRQQNVRTSTERRWNKCAVCGNPDSRRWVAPRRTPACELMRAVSPRFAALGAARSLARRNDARPAHTLEQPRPAPTPASTPSTGTRSRSRCSKVCTARGKCESGSSRVS